MSRRTAVLTAAIAVTLAMAMPLSAGAQFKRGQGGGQSQGQGRGGAPHAAHIQAPRAAPHFQAQRPAMHAPAFHPRAVQRAVPHFTRRSVAPHLSRQHVARPHFTPRRAATSHVTRHRTIVRRRAPTINRAAQRRIHEQRAHRNRVTPRNALVQPNAERAARARTTRHDRVGGVTRQAARQGRFAAAFAADPQARAGQSHRHRPHWAARRAWHRGLRAAFVPWYGPVFWPYAYSDIFDYAFWPYGYEDDYWAYAYDNFFDGVFWGEYGPPEEYTQDYAYAAPAGASAPRVTHAAIEELCTEPGTGITAWPFAAIERKVGLNAEQKRLLGDVRDAAKQAAVSFKASCPAQQAFPRTPPGRLDAMTSRVAATLQAVETVRAPLEKFYNSLSDEQKARFNDLGPKSEKTKTAAGSADSCKQPKAGLSNLPIETIDAVVKPTDAQEAGFKKLQDATGKSVSILQEACPNDTPLTPPGRLEAMQQRLKAMIDAANTVKPALADFYGSLSNEQKARFNRLGGQLAKADE